MKNKKINLLITGLVSVAILAGGFFVFSSSGEDDLAITPPSEAELSFLNEEERYEFDEFLQTYEQDLNAETAYLEGGSEDESFLENMSSWRKRGSSTCRNSEYSCRKLSCYTKLSLDKNKELLIKGAALGTLYGKKSVSFKNKANIYKSKNRRIYNYYYRMYKKYKNYANTYNCMMGRTNYTVKKNDDARAYIDEGVRVSLEDMGRGKKYPRRVNWGVVAGEFEEVINTPVTEGIISNQNICEYIGGYFTTLKGANDNAIRECSPNEIDTNKTVIETHQIMGANCYELKSIGCMSPPAPSEDQATKHAWPSLEMSMDNETTGPGGVGNVKYSQNMLAGTTTDFVAAIKLKATNENVILEKAGVNIYSSGQSYNEVYNTIESINLYDDSGTIIAQGSLSPNNDNVVFENINLDIGQTNERIYVKYVLKKMGRDTMAVPINNLSLGFEVLKAKGLNSGRQLTKVSVNGTDRGIDANDGASTEPSNPGSVVAAKIAGVSIVNSGNYGGSSVNLEQDSSNLAGEGKVIGIIKVDVASTTNTDDSGNTLKVILEKLKVKISKNAGMGFRYPNNPGTPIWIERLGGNQDNKTFMNMNIAASAGLSSSMQIESYQNSAGTGNVTAIGYTTIYAAFNTIPGENIDAEITPGTTAYFVVKANIEEELGNGNDYILVGLDSLNGDTPPSIGSSATESASNLTWGVRKDSTSITYGLESGKTNLRLGGATESTNSSFQIDEID